MAAHNEERRASPRCDVVKNRSSVEFATAEGFRRVEAKLVNISRDGALVVAEEEIPQRGPLFLRIESPVKTDWVEATVVRFHLSRNNAVRFSRGCPDDLLLAATVGIDLAFLVRNEANITTASD